MNNLSYQIFIYKQNKSESVAIDLQKADFLALQKTLGSFFRNKKDLFEVEVKLGYGSGQLVNKSNLLEKFYDKIRDNLKSSMNHVQNYFGLEMIQVFTFQNFDCLLNVDDILFQLIKDMQYLKELIVGSRKELSCLIFSQLIDAINFKRQSLEKLGLLFGVKEDQNDITINRKLDYIKHLFLSELTSAIQLNAFKLAQRIEEVKILTSVDSRLQIETIVDQLLITNSSLQKLYLDIDQNRYYLQSKNSLISIEKLQNLRTLYLKALSLKNEILDIQKLKKLEKLSLIFSDAIDYLSSHSNLNQLVELELDVRACDVSLLKVNNLKNLRTLHLNFKQNLKKETNNMISCLQKFSQIAHQLDELSLDFSESSYFWQNTMNTQLIESIGFVFEKCNEETTINLNNQKCLFNTEKRFELAHQMMKIKNYKKFSLNGVCIYDELCLDNEISSSTLGCKFHYFLSIFSQCQELRNKIVNFDQKYLQDNKSILENKNSFFSNFKNFSLSSFPLYETKQLSEMFINILPQEVVFINLPKHFYMIYLIKNSKKFKHIQTIQSEEIQIDRFLETIQPKQIKEAFTQNLNLKFTKMYSNYSENKKSYQDLFELKGYVIEIKLICSFNKKDLVELFEFMKNNNNNIIYLNLKTKYEYHLPIEYKATQHIIENYTNLITSYCTDTLIQVLTISTFNNYLIEHIYLHPKLLYLDLYF
ncbi:hypothetical protein TTHERM_01054350 (macronuclear) [Tetrahymena thermophila SB210]|uniref:Uncharacterized protein n=1 Tax=Tetrahymena thermophila (strain SB210) TaxID=312017 RepID=Q22CB6_TETTS|nr:hypothetical protein TTHERM_01054350 [Tetrahymena thermophila SB210]EAR82950.2 hypothetical protein TTHERM_01054350 [Tetrahymena thermophila SB210]|eukprot:XP_001030613.2 hypothetical protein TTHERM_01054350 [Tetrahymena thermophila SB210]